MAIQGIEWLAIPAVIIVIAVLLWRLRLKKGRVIENVVLSLIRSKNGATLDDIIIGAHISADDASAILRKFLAKGVLKVDERDGKTIYRVA
jgi:predicted transcriptional regulator